MSDRTAALIEPISIGMHAALNSRPFHDGPALVVGSGPIALGTIWALRAAGYHGELIAQVKRAHEAEIARSLGADHTVSPGHEARQALIDTGAQGYAPILGDEVYCGGGFPLIFDCVGSRESITQCLRYAAPRARIVESWHGERAHTFQITHDMLLQTGAPVESLVTHVFPLGEYRQALSTAANRQRTGSIKVLLDPTETPPVGVEG